ncbi:MAG TPA: hypothetical protein VI452_14320 [Marmoricola sp.]
MSTRVWLPAIVDDLRQWWTDREVPPVAGHAVTRAVQESWPEAAEEEWEYAVLLAAADDAAAMLPAPGPRVVVVVEADGVEPGEGSAVRLTAPVPWRRLAAVLADPPGTQVPANAPADELPDLGWYAVQEVPALVGAPPA